MNGYNLTRAWFDFAFENQGKVTGNHTALYLWNVELNNRMGWVKQFNSPTSQMMAATGITSYNTFKKVFYDLVGWDFIILVKDSKNQYVSKIISLTKIERKNNSLDFALSKNDTPLTEHDSSIVHDTVNGTVQSTVNGTVHDSVVLIKPLNLEPLNLEPLNISDGEKNFTVVIESKVYPSQEEKNNSTHIGSSEKPSKKVAQKKVSKSDEEYSLTHRMKLIVEHRQTEYYWTAKDAANAKGLADKLRFGWNKRNPNANASDTDILDLFEKLLDRLPPFYAEKWDIGMLNSGYNTIIKQIKDGTGKQANSGKSGAINADRFETVLELINERRKERQQTGNS